MRAVFSARELLLEIKSGEGGDDAKDFVHDLFAAYAKYARSKSLVFEILDSAVGSAVAKVSGAGVCGAFSREAGKHVVQRIPFNEKNGRRQTSIVVVGVLPLPEPRDQQPLAERDLAITTMRGTGPGGQHRNNTESCVRVVHRPTCLQAVVDMREQSKSKREAIRIVTAKVHDKQQRQSADSYNAVRKSQMSDQGRGDKVRTYNFLRSHVVDHRTGKETKDVKGVMKGRFDLVL